MKIGVLGASGRMGKMVVQEVLSGQYNAELGAAIDLNDNKADAFQACDVMIDFTAP
ncbi:MAG: 4-hydroxy-tetrahydrodipicolinate reductase, partial [Proteobacteria bacterium]|nr:4-hydroxy-tetrahydrodipicolinate reductase [Pseudomonadota bacterium]